MIVPTTLQKCTGTYLAAKQLGSLLSFDKVAPRLAATPNVRNIILGILKKTDLTQN